VDLQPGSTFGSYRIVAPLGRGGMAAVYEAHDPSLDRRVALKVLPAEFLHDPAFADRFRQEARVAARLEHPHIVPIHAYGIEGGRPWMAMRLVPGGSLAERVRRAPLSPGETASILRDVAEALDFAHARGVVHRDVKPANVLLDEAGRAYLADFGIARMLEGSSVATATGLIQGTPSYMAPEQAMGAKVGGLADVYALGVVAFECLTGRVPYTGTTPVAILMKHVQEPVPEPTESEVAPALTAALRRCLAKAPAERWPTAGAFAIAVERAVSGSTPPDLAASPAIASRAEPTSSLALAPPAPAPSARASVGRNLVLAAVGAALALVLLVLGGVWLLPVLLGPSPPARASPAAAVIPETRPLPQPSQPPSGQAERSPRPVATPVPARPSVLPTSPVVPPTSGTVTPASRHETVPAEPGPLEPPPAAPVPGAAAPTVAARSGPIRVYCEASLEPVLYRKTGPKDVADSLKDLKEAMAERGGLALVPRDEAEALVQVLERGREPAVFGMRKLRVRVVLGRETVELTGQDAVTGFNTWSGAAKGAAKQVEAWLKTRLATRPRE
jgi:eukaryotic-like serine/threonine-protein kinase